MSDSIDRVFAHALQTVRKIPRATASNNVPGSPSLNAGGSTGTASSSGPSIRRPPAEVRLRLYGLYKQSMEGDVLGVMERPTDKAEADKWDAWNAVRGMGKTEAKRRYIECLIETMKKYASDTPDAKELVSELEFVWDQVKSNSRHHSANGSNASNTYTPRSAEPTQPQKQQQTQVQLQMHYQTLSQRPPPSPTSAPVSKYRQEPSRPPDYLDEPDYRGYQSSGDHEHLISPGQPYYEHSHDAGEPRRYLPLKRMKVGSRGTRSIRSGDDGDQTGDEEAREADTAEEDEDEEEEDDSEDDELFEEPSMTRLHHNYDQDDDEEYDEDGFRTRLVLGRDTSPDLGTMRWQLRVERALTKMSGEIAALREQLEIRNAHVLQNSSSWFWPHSDSSRRQSMTTTGGKKDVAGVPKTFGKVIWQVIWNVLRHLMVDAVVVGIVVWWMGRKEDRRAGEIWKWLTKIIGSRRRRRGDGLQTGIEGS
ncbi:acyl CoA binding protein-domain-containing protein [Kalaharituber pfeilii]|nr:acyl CoA binding protein-domain-containing protein [Kalaharituber pfeilii]